MKFKPVLLGTVSLASLAAATGIAVSQDAGPSGYTLSVEGGGMFGANTVAEDKLGSAGSAGEIVEIQDNVSYRGSVAIGQRIDESLDWKIALGFTQQVPSSAYVDSSGGPSSGYAELESAFNFQTADLEIGFSPSIDAANVRLFGGLRGMHFNDSSDKLGYQSGGSGGLGLETNYDNEFIGAGPRVGVEGSMALGDSNFGLSGLLAASAIYGVQRATLDATYFSGGLSVPVPVPGSGEEWGTIFDIEAALGVDVYLNDQTTLTVGVRAENISGISGLDDIFGGSGGSGGSSESRFSYGPTVKLVSSF